MRHRMHPYTCGHLANPPILKPSSWIPLHTLSTDVAGFILASMALGISYHIDSLGIDGTIHALAQS
jgi:hypothetical protein